MSFNVNKCRWPCNNGGIQGNFFLTKLKVSMNWIEINDGSQLKVDDILRFVIGINGKPEDGIIYKILKISKNFIVIKKVNHF
jgi:hypothetical protein